MKALTAVTLALAACASLFFVPAKAALHTFDQPAAGMLPVAFDDDCTPCTTYPNGYPAPIGTHFTQYLVKCTFITHDLYWPTSDTGAPYSITLTQNQLNWINTKENAYLSAQAVLLDLYLHPVTNPSPNYCINIAACGGDYPWLFWPVAIGSGCVTGQTATYMNQATYDAVTDAAFGMTCCQCFIRTLL